MTYPYRTTMALNTYQYRETTMIDPKKIEQIARQVHESMPKGIREFGEDVEKKIRQTLQAQLTRLDLVSREEFDVQTQVLLRTREKLALLEQRISELENRSTEIKKQPDLRGSREVHLENQGGNAMRLNDNNTFIGINPPYQLMVIHSSKLIYPREIPWYAC